MQKGKDALSLFLQDYLHKILQMTDINFLLPSFHSHSLPQVGSL